MCPWPILLRSMSVLGVKYEPPSGKTNNLVSEQV